MFLIGDYKFVIDFQNAGKDKLLLAIFNPGQSCSLNISDMLSQVWAEAGELIPKDLAMSIKVVFLVMVGHGQDGMKMVFGFESGITIDMSKAGILESMLGKDAKIGVEDLQIVVASGAVAETQIKAIIAL